MEGRLYVDGADLRYTDEGHGDPVLLIHQAGADSTTWGDVRKHLLRDHRVITYDRRGFSGSVFEGAPTLSRHAQDAIALLEHLQAVPATVAGTSVGATIALQIALERPDVVRTMVLHELPFHSKRYPDLGAARTFMRVARLAKRGEAEEAAELFLRWAYRYPEGGTAFDRMPKSWREVARRNAIASLNDLQIATAENTIPTRLVRKTIVPAVCLVGDKSPRPMHAFVRRLTKALPNATGGTIERSAHAVTFDQPVAFATKIHAAASAPRPQAGTARRVR